MARAKGDLAFPEYQSTCLGRMCEDGRVVGGRLGRVLGQLGRVLGQLGRVLGRLGQVSERPCRYSHLVPTVPHSSSENSLLGWVTIVLLDDLYARGRR